MACDDKGLIGLFGRGGRLCAQEYISATFFLYKLQTGTNIAAILHAMAIIVMTEASKHAVSRRGSDTVDNGHAVSSLDLPICIRDLNTVLDAVFAGILAASSLVLDAREHV